MGEDPSERQSRSRVVG